MRIKIDLTTLQAMLRCAEQLALDTLSGKLREAIDAEAREVAGRARRLAEMRVLRARGQLERSLNPYGRPEWQRPADMPVETPEQTAEREQQRPTRELRTIHVEGVGDVRVWVVNRHKLRELFAEVAADEQTLAQIRAEIARTIAAHEQQLVEQALLVPWTGFVSQLFADGGGDDCSQD